MPGLQIPSYFALILRAFSVIEGIALRVDPQYSIVQECFPYIARRLLTDNHPRTRAALQQLLYAVRTTLSPTCASSSVWICDKTALLTLLHGCRQNPTPAHGLHFMQYHHETPYFQAGLGRWNTGKIVSVPIAGCALSNCEDICSLYIAKSLRGNKTTVIAGCYSPLPWQRVWRILSSL